MSRIRSQRQRRGASNLVELLSIIASTAMLVSVCTVTLSAMMKSRGATFDRRYESLSLDRLQRAFQDDVHQSVAAAVQDDGSLVLNRGPQEVQYDWQERRIRRTLREGDNVHRDWYALGAGRTLVENGSFEVKNNIARMSFSATRSTHRRDWSIAAAIGLARQLAAQPLNTNEREPSP